MIHLHRLEGFYHCACHGGYARAARNFPYPISQPAVHQQVRKLERELGAQLFERVAHDRIALTSAGRRLFDFCAPFFELLPAVSRAIAERSYGGALRIDAAALEIRHVMPRWLKRLRQLRPDIEIDLEEIQTPDLERLRSGRADLAVDFLAELPLGFEARRVGTHWVFLVLPSNVRHHPKTLKSLRDRPFVGFHPSLPHYALQRRALESAGVPGRPTLTASSTDAILGFVQAGLGYSLVPWPDARGPRLSGVQAIRQTGKGTEFPILALWRKRPIADPLVEAALGALDD